MLEWQREAIKTSERQLVAFQQMQAVAQRKESEKRELLDACKAITQLARYNTKWNLDEIELNPSKLPTLTLSTWHKLRAAIARATEYA